MKYLAAQTSITRFWNFLVLCTETGTERYVCGESSMSGGVYANILIGLVEFSEFSPQ